MPLTETDYYREGSEACRNYSKLTMHVRTLSQQVLLGSGLALAIFFSTPRSPETVGTILVCVGVSMVMFSVGLMYVGCHFQMAFEAVRDSLAKLEQMLPNGPWSFHKEARKEQDVSATYIPLLIPGIVGTLGVGLGAWFLCDVIGIGICSNRCWLVVGVGLVLALAILFVPSCLVISAHKRAAKKRDDRA